MNETIRRLNEAAESLGRRCPELPRYAVVLGSGLGELLDQLEVECDVPYPDIPYFRASTVIGHKGRLLVGRARGARLVILQGRLHYYEGYPMADVVFPVRLLARMGVECFFLTNAAGGLHPEMKPGELVLLRDHVNLTGTSPLIGPNLEELGPRFPDMTEAYDRGLAEAILATAGRVGVGIRQGVYVGLHGPSYETPAEIRAHRSLGGDVVGMSTVPEVIALRHMGRRVAGISCVTNLAAGVSPEPLVHEEVLENARRGYAALSKLILETIASFEGE